MITTSILRAIAARGGTLQVVEGKEGETIEIPEGSGLLLTACNNCTINAPGKNTKVTIERCTDTAVRVGAVLAVLEIIHCTAVEVSMQRCG